MFDLASHLHMTVEKLETEMSSSELTQWIARNNVFPFDDPWLRHAILNANLQKCHGAKKWEPEKWLPRPPRKRKQTTAEIFATLDGYAR